MFQFWNDRKALKAAQEKADLVRKTVERLENGFPLGCGLQFGSGAFKDDKLGMVRVLGCTFIMRNCRGEWNKGQMQLRVENGEDPIYRLATLCETVAVEIKKKWRENEALRREDEKKMDASILKASGLPVEEKKAEGVAPTSLRLVEQEETPLGV